MSTPVTLFGAVALAMLGFPFARGVAFAQDAPVPPNVEDAPVEAEGGGFCYVGAHPVDTRVAAGPAWDATEGAHRHTYPPLDLRLFARQDDCYYFVGDPMDFGYQGQAYEYYGAHPVHQHYGGGWCFMIGGHAHLWQPWSPYFVVTGPWFYWSGPYDAFFWSYWPYYSFYYRAHYPRFYRGGRFHRGSNRHRAVAPPIGRVSAPPSPALPPGVQAGPAGWNIGRPPSPGIPPQGKTASGRERALRDTSVWARPPRSAGAFDQTWSTGNTRLTHPQQEDLPGGPGRRVPSPAFPPPGTTDGFRTAPSPAARVPAPAFPPSTGSGRFRTAPGFRVPAPAFSPMSRGSGFRVAPSRATPSFGGGGAKVARPRR